MMEFIWPVRVYYEDTDSGGVVYYANYLKFMERARTEWLRQLGFEQDELLEKEGILFAVRRVSVDYLRPARFNDELLVSASISKQGRASLTFQQEIRMLTARRCAVARCRWLPSMLSVSGLSLFRQLFWS